MASDADLAWLAGLSDAEACFSARMNGAREHSVIVQYEIGLVREDVMNEVRRLISEIIGAELPELIRDPPKKDRRAFFRCRVVRKEHVRTLLAALLPFLCGKHTEARVGLDILERAAAHAKYRATPRDAALCGASRGLKRGDPEAAAEAVRLLGKSNPIHEPGASWVAGMFDGDGSVSMGATRRDGRTYYQPFVNISSSDLVALSSTKATVERMGFGTTSVSTQRLQGSARDSHRFGIVASDMNRFFLTVRPFLRVKSVEADVLLDVFRGTRTLEAAYPVLRSLKRTDDPEEDLVAIDRGEPPVAHAPTREYRRPTYDEMKERGLWSSEEARAHLGGIKHAVWVKLTEGLVPDGTIGNKKYYAPRRLRQHIGETVNRIVRTDTRKRVVESMDSWDSWDDGDR